MRSAAALALLVLGASAAPAAGRLEIVDDRTAIDPTALLTCDDPGVAGPGGTINYYAVKGACGLTEGP